MKPPITTETSVQFLKSVGPARARGLSRLGIETVGQLLAHYPRRYFDRTSAVPIDRAPVGQEVTVLGHVLTANERRTHGGGTLQTVTLGDETGVLFCIWFNQHFMLKQFRPGRKVMASGRVQMNQGRLQMAHPDFELLSTSEQDHSQGLNTGRLVPVYSLTAGIGQHWLRALIFQALEKLEPGRKDSLPAALVRERELCPARTVLSAIHFPRDRAALEAARRRLKYEEGLFSQLLLAVRRAESLALPAVKLNKPGDLTARLVRDLPFELTGAQRRVLGEILADLRSGRVMHRLLQGDVGCGKTLVAFISSLFVVEQGYQSLMMAPTEVLARQHGRTLAALAEPLSLAVETLTGSTPASQRRKILAAAAQGEVDLLVGTHAVIQEDVRIPRLALSIVDEQHRFGVRQRGQSARGGDAIEQSHVLVMSATPIPRSLALTLYGDLDLSLIDELPQGRQPIVTRVVAPSGQDEVWRACRRELAAGRQVFVVHPVIEETEGQDLKAATVEFERLAGDVFKDWEVGLLHGRLKSAAKQQVMTDFLEGRIQVLVATTVVEVGVDVPNATAMVIQNPERFGLAQLHQLRGRIGRGPEQGTCWLLCDRSLSGPSLERVQFFAGHLDGFALAEQDLRTRGPGQATGQRQHGAPDFQLLNPIADLDLIRLCQADSRRILDRDPHLQSEEGKALRLALAEQFDRNRDLLTG